MERLKGKKLAIDTMLLIYLLESDGERAQKVGKLFERAGVLTCSSFLLGEVSAGFYRAGEGRKAELFLRFIEDQGFEVLPFDQEQALAFAKIRGRFPQYSSPDCIHLAAALAAGADYFVTNDQALKSFDDLKILYLDGLRG